MKSTLILVAGLALGMAALDADAARRFGGGGNLGKQRAAPTSREAVQPAPATPAQAPAQGAAAQPAAGGAAAAAAAKPSFMSRWGGMLAGLGIGVLLASLFGAQLGPIVGALLAMLLVAAVVYFLFRLFAGRRAPEARPATVPFAGIGAAVPRGELEGAAPLAAPPAGSVREMSPSFEVEPFLRVAKTSFIRLQAANDAKDLDDIRDYTTPEMYAEIAMQIRERGDAPQKTEVVSVEARLVDVDVEDGYEIASVRFWGLLRESPGANPESFDEIWHVRKKVADRKGSWLIAGIQQTEGAL